MPTPKVLMSGLSFGESTRWRNGRLWFADWGTAEIIAVTADGAAEVVLRVPTAGDRPAGGAVQGPFSIDWLRDGRLLIVAGRDKRLLRREPDGALVDHADVSRHGWNEIVVDGRGNAYINGAGFDFTAGEAFAPGIIALVTPDGRVRQVADGIAFPNGMAVTPDNRTLIIADSYGRKLTAFDIAEGGDLSGERVWADLEGGCPDGICIDADGAVWYADVPNKCCARVREGGEVLDRVALDRGGFACALGGPDRRTLFIAATEWRGPAASAELAGTGQILTYPAPATAAGWP